jgi:hypothetical protein
MQFLKLQNLLKNHGTFVLSIEKNQPEITDYGSRKIRMFPDRKEDILQFIENANLHIKHVEEIENAYIIVSSRLTSNKVE